MDDRNVLGREVYDGKWADLGSKKIVSAERNKRFVAEQYDFGTSGNFHESGCRTFVSLYKGTNVIWCCGRCFCGKCTCGFADACKNDF